MKKVKIVINDCYGGFGIKEKYKEIITKSKDYIPCYEFRTHPELIRLIEELGSEEVSDNCSSLKVVEINEGTKYRIEDYDGLEHIAYDSPDY
jgi:hypothetical protein